MRNLGTKSCSWLTEVGVGDRTRLEKLGAVTVFQMVKQAGFPATNNLLWALEGAIRDCDWRELPESVKRALLLQLHQGDADHS